MRAAVCLLMLYAAAAAKDTPRQTYFKVIRKLDLERFRLIKRDGWRISLDLIRNSIGFERAPDRINMAKLDELYARYNKEWEKAAAKRYGEFIAIERSRGRAAAIYGASADERATGDLTDRLLSSVTEAGKIETEHRKKGKIEDGAQAYAITLRIAALRRALAGRRDGATHVAEKGLSRARKRDRGGSARHRVAMVDVLGLARTTEAAAALVPLLEHKDHRLRIAAAEALFATETPPHTQLTRLAGDPHPAVRRAVFGTVAASKESSALWIAPAITAYEPSTGAERTALVRLLQQLTGELNDDVVADWKAWLSKHAAVIASGEFKPPNKKPMFPGPPRIRFARVLTASSRCLFVFEGSNLLRAPANWSMERRHAPQMWGRYYIFRKELDHATAHAARVGEAILGAYKDVRVNVALYRDVSKPLAHALSTRNLVKARKSAARDASALLLQQGRDGSAGIERLLEVLDALAKAKDPPDTCYLVSTGYFPDHPHAAAVAERFARWNRFRRWTVHAIHFSGEPARCREAMQAIAKGAGGQYRRVSD